MAEEPHPEVRAVIEQAEERLLPPAQALTPASARRRLEDLFATQPVEDVESVEDVAIPGPESALPVRLYEPAAESPHPVLVYLHGGGYVAGSLDTHDNVCAALTNRADCLTVSVDYRLAPEHPFPAALEDGYAALEWVHEFGEHVGADTDRVALAGDSAGGNLTAAVALLARDRGGPDIARQVLVYPAVASPSVHEFDSWAENAEGYLLERAGSEWYVDRYVDSAIDRRNEYFAPLLVDDLSGLPPATVVTAGFDPLRDEGIEYADRLAAAGVEVEHHHYDDVIHGFVSLQSVISRGEEAIEAVARDLRATL
jgi:acetyl esterase